MSNIKNREKRHVKIEQGHQIPLKPITVNSGVEQWTCGLLVKEE